MISLRCRFLACNLLPPSSHCKALANPDAGPDFFVVASDTEIYERVACVLREGLLASMQGMRTGTYVPRPSTARSIV